MYYKLTKADYKKKEKEFRKTYVGRDCFRSYMISMVFFFCVSVINAFTFINCEAKVNMADLSECIFDASVLIISGFMAIMFGIRYLNEFKEYVNTSKTK